MKLIDEIVAAAPDIAALRRRLHAQPELSFQEEKTSALVAETLKGWGVEVHRGLARTGVVGVIRNGTSARGIGLRADMDALPMQEENSFAYASTCKGKMHACGHDGHTAMLLGAAQYLAKHRNFDGTVYLIFQPAEENGAGGQVMVSEGLFEQFAMDAVFGMHNWPGLPVGTMAVSAGPVMASCSDFKLRIQGKGGHAAMPDVAIDCIPIACQIVLGWQNIISRFKNVFDAAVLSVTNIHAGQALNVIPGVCELGGTVRTFDAVTTDFIETRMRELAQHICTGYGATCTFEFDRTYVATINAEKEAAFARQVMLEILPAEQVSVQKPSMASEDFGFMLNAKAGAYAFIGNGDGSDHAGEQNQGNDLQPCDLHNPTYDFNDAIIPLGATYWVRLAERFLPFS